MKPSIAFSLLTILCLSLTSCQKQIPTVLTGYFYTTNVPENEESFLLFMDGQLKGALPYASIDQSKISIINADIKNSTLKVEFMSGSHKIEAKKKDGTIISTAVITHEFYRNKHKSGLSGSGGGASSSSFNAANTDVLVSLFH